MKLEKAKKRLKELAQEIEKIPKTAKWEDLTDYQRSLFAKNSFLGRIGSLMMTECPDCKKKFDKPLCSEKYGWNVKFLFHLGSTHGWGTDLDSIINIIQCSLINAVKGKSKEY